MFETRDDFKKWLAGPDSDFMLPNPGVEPITFWSRNLQEDLGDEYEVLSISMPLKQHAKYDEWKIWFEKHIQFMQDEIILVGWSLGATFLFKYLSEETYNKKVTSLHLVSGRFGQLDSFEYTSKMHLNENISATYIYHSSDDEIVSFDDAALYKEALPGGTLVEFEDRGHFLVEHIPELIENIKKDY